MSPAHQLWLLFGKAAASAATLALIIFLLCKRIRSIGEPRALKRGALQLSRHYLPWYITKCVFSLLVLNFQIHCIKSEGRLWEARAWSSLPKGVQHFEEPGMKPLNFKPPCHSSSPSFSGSWGVGSGRE